jgi:hypothetical protein
MRRISQRARPQAWVDEAPSAERQKVTIMAPWRHWRLSATGAVAR